MKNTANLLLVDDVPQNLTALESILDDLDCNIFKATSANEALRLVLHHDFALLLLDVQMPDMNGFELAELLRGRQETRQIPLIFVTAISKEQKYVFRGYEIGAVDYLFKPIEPDILRSKIRVFLELYKQRQVVEQQAHALEKKMQALENEIKERERVEEELQKHQDQLEELVKARTVELTSATEALRKLNQELQEASRHKTDFLANMSHELRTPLNAMIGYTSLTLNALKKDLPSEHLENLMKAERSARALLQLINDVLDFSKIEAGRTEVFVEELDLSEILEDLLITAEGLLVDKSLELQTDIEADLPEVLSDYTKVKQILNNLIGNAIKFTNEGYVAVRAKKLETGNSKLEHQSLRDEYDNAPYPVSNLQSPVCVRVEVEDTGSGIPRDKLDNIFESFRQIDGSIKKKFGGTGLGLAITKRLCELLHIDIGVQSEEHKGTMFWLHIPGAFQAKNSEEIQQPSTDVTELAGLAPTLQTDTKTSVLCFCDPERIASLKPHFQDLPIEFQTVETLAECVEIMHSQSVWAVLVNPEKLSAEEMTILKQEFAIRGIPVIMHSPSFDTSDQPEGRLEFFTGSLDKANMMEALFKITRMQKGDILVIDDEVEARELYGMVLSQAGYTLHFARSGKEALSILSEQRLPQAIILDLMMPGMDGFQVLERIQNHKAWKKTPVIVITAQTLSTQQRRLLDKGSQLLLEKGRFSITHLSEHIQSVLTMMAAAMTSSILLVDDNLENLDLFANIFRLAGYQVYTARSGQKGIDIAKETAPDIILMDLAMPGMDGFEATQQIKQHPGAANVTVIACSAFSTQDYRKRAFQVGCEGYITKPIEPAMLVDQVAKLTLMSRLQKQLIREA